MVPREQCADPLRCLLLWLLWLRLCLLQKSFARGSLWPPFGHAKCTCRAVHRSPVWDRHTPGDSSRAGRAISASGRPSGPPVITANVTAASRACATKNDGEPGVQMLNTVLRR